MLEVADGIYLQGDELDEYCLKNGLCNKCGKTKVRRKVKKVFGSTKWEPITTVKVETLLKSSKRSVKANIEKGNDDNVEYLVYKGYCLKEKCYTLEQAKMLSGTKSHRGFGSATSSASAGSVSSNQSNTDSNTKNKKKKSKLFSFRRKSSPKHAAASSNDSNASPTPEINENTMFMTLPQATQ